MSPKDPRYAQIPTGEPQPRPSLGGLMKGRRALITGVANDRSIASPA
jgi:hypothetical protein